MNREVMQFCTRCVAVVCSVLWRQGKGTIKDLWQDIREFESLLNLRN